MQIVHVDVVCLECLQALAQGRLRVHIACMPQFCRQENVTSLDTARLDGIRDTLANLRFIHGDRSSVNVSITNVDYGISDGFGILVEESAQAHSWHFSTICQSHGGLESFLL